MDTFVFLCTCNQEASNPQTIRLGLGNSCPTTTQILKGQDAYDIIDLIWPCGYIKLKMSLTADQPVQW